MTDNVLADLNDGILRLKLNDPETLNALTPEMVRVLTAHLERASADPDVRVVVLSGTGRAFSSGGNVRAFGTADPGDRLAAKWAGTPAWNATEMRTDRLRVSARSSVLLHTMPKPTIAMVRGAVAGAGLSLAAACDFRIASVSAMFTTAFARLGTSGDFGGSLFLTRLLGPTKAKELLFLSGRTDAATALQIGLVSRVVAEEDLETETIAFAAALAQAAPIALRSIKENVAAALDGTMESAIAVEARNMVRCFQTEDFKEGVAALREKRPANFQGR